MEICLRGQFLIMMTADYSGLESDSEVPSRSIFRISSPLGRPFIKPSGAQLDVDSEPLTTDILLSIELQALHPPQTLAHP